MEECGGGVREVVEECGGVCVGGVVEECGGGGV